MSKRPVYFATTVASLIFLGGCGLQLQAPGSGLGLLVSGSLIGMLTLSASRFSGGAS